MRRFVCVVILLFCSQQVWAGTLYVPSPYSTIQSAIDNAFDGDTVVVSTGTYIENIDFKGKAITVQSTDPNDTNVVAATIINGSNPADPNFGSVVLFRSGEDANSVLAGFTITGGTGSWLAVAWDLQQIYWNRCGGGVLCYNMSAPTITKNVFTDNLAGQGGGIYVYGDPVNPNDPSNPPFHISPVITDNIFIDNTALIEHGFTPPDTNYPLHDNGDGGAIVCFQGVDAVISGNFITNNHAKYYGGGIHLRQWSNGLIAENVITDNNSALGGGIHITYSSSPTVQDNLISGNITGTFGGGGIYVYYLSQPLIERNTITNNTSPNGAGIAVYCTSAGTIRNNLIFKNNSGAGLRIIDSYPTIAYNTITGNFKNGIECQPTSSPVITGNIIASNGSGYGIRVEPNSFPVITYNDVWNNDAGTTGPAIPDQTGSNGNISSDPRFIDPDANNFHIDYLSPCINAGDPNYLPTGQADYDGDSRVVGARIDIGADEALPAWNITSENDYQTIQQAVDDSNDGDVIVVTTGTHTGTGNRDIEFNGKAITLQSIDPNAWDIVAATIIDVNGSDPCMHRGFHIRGGEGPNTVVAGLTITRGGGVYDGGAIRCYNYSSPTIKNCIITANLSGGRGVLHCERYSSPLISDCIFTNNRATRGYGAGVSIWYNSSPTVTNCVFFNNHAEGNGHHGGAIYCHDHSDAFIADCIIAGNTAGHRGGGIAAYWSNPTYLNCTVIGNKSLEGGGLSSFRESHPLVINCIVRDNFAPDGNQLALINTLRVWGYDYGTAMTVMSSNIEGGIAAATVDVNCSLNWLSGNIDIDPCFVNPGFWDDANTPAEPNDDVFTAGNYHLLPGSPCIDAGDTGSIPPFLTTDIDGEERIFNDVVDMGADEMVTNPFDLNSDGIVDYSELAALADEWLQTGLDLQTDFNPDQKVDLADFALLAWHWFWTAGWYH
jgi:parallel beta-helix repeat protein